MSVEFWRATHDGIEAICLFNYKSNRYIVTVYDGTHFFHDSFKLTCWTPPIFRAMDVGDSSIIYRMAETLAQKIEALY